MKRVGLFLLILPGLLWFPLSAWGEAEVEFKGFMDSTWGCSLRSPWNMTTGTTRIHPAVEIFAGDFYFFVSVNGEYNTLIPSKRGFSLKEAYVDYMGSSFDFRMGRQIVVWGRADGVEITDIISPKDSTALAGQEYEDTRLSVDALKARLFGTSYTLEALWIPFAAWAELPSDPDNPLTEQFFSSPGGGVFTLEKGDVPRELSDSGAAFRASFFLPFMDFSLSCYSGQDGAPALKPKAPGTAVLVPDYQRIWMAGLDLALPAGSFVFRGESAVIGNKALAGTNPLSPVTGQTQWKALAGVDWNPGNSWMLTAQYMEDWILDPDDAVKRRSRIPSATLNVSKSLLRETLELSCMGMLNFNDLDSALSLKADYAFSDNFSLTLGSLLFFQGRDKGTYGAMEDLSSLWLRGRFSL